MTLRPGSTARWWRSASAAMGSCSRSNAPRGIGHPTGVHRDRQPLLLDPGVCCVGPAQHRRQLPLEGCEPGRGTRRADPLLGGRPPLVAVLPEDEQLGAAVEHRVAQRVEVAHGDQLACRTAGDHRDCTHHLGELQERSRGTRVQACRLGVVDDGRERAVEVETDHDSVEDVAYGVVVGAGAVGGELHGPQPITRRRRPPKRSSDRAEASGGHCGASVVRMTVRRSSFIVPTAGEVRLMPRSRASCLPSALSRGGK